MSDELEKVTRGKRFESFVGTFTDTLVGMLCVECWRNWGVGDRAYSRVLVGF